MYTIGQVSQMSGLPISTLRYYDKEGLFPNLRRTSGIRQFDDHDLEALHVIECLKRSGLEIRDIKQFMQWCAEGPATYGQRRELFERQREAVEAQIADLERSLAMIEFKCWYYDQAIADGDEERLAAMLPDKLPPDVQALYDHAHGADLADRAPEAVREAC